MAPSSLRMKDRPAGALPVPAEHLPDYGARALRNAHAPQPTAPTMAATPR